MEIIQVISGVIVIVGALFGALWTYYRFRRLREVKKSLTINILPTIHAHNDDTIIIEVLIELICTGTIPIFVSSTKSCLIYFKAVPTFEDDTVLGLVDDRYQLLARPVEYLNHFDGASDQIPVTLEPGVPSEVRGYAILSTGYKGLILLHVEFCDKEGIYWIEGKIIDTRVENEGRKIAKTKRGLP